MGKCNICQQPIRNPVRGKAGIYHRDCLRMQNKGLLWTGNQARPKDSTGKSCSVCGDVIDGDHCHRFGAPLHKECLT